MIGVSAIPTLSPPVAGTAARPFAHVEIFSESAPLTAWAELEAVTPCSIYQTRGFLLPWLATLGAKAGLRPLFILARAADATPMAMLCLGVRRQGPLRVASFLGGKDSNLNLPLVRDPESWTPATLRLLLRETTQTLDREAPDVFVLANQPFDWRGIKNPFATLPHQASPSAAYGTSLPRDVEHLFATKLSKGTRKNLRKKEAKLAALGPVTHRIAASADDRAKILAAFLAQKLARFQARGIRSDFDTPEMQAFIETASGGIELHALLAGERIVATYGGAAHDGQWSGMFNSFDADAEIAKSSPGDLLLMRIMAKACAEGLTRFDLGIGEARYKAALCDETIPLFDIIIPVSLPGRLYALYVETRQHAKRIVKASPRLMSLAKRLRAP